MPPIRKGAERPAHWKKPGPRKRADAAERGRQSRNAAARRYYDRNREAILLKKRLQRRKAGCRERAAEAKYRAAHREEIAARERASCSSTHATCAN